MGQPAAKQDDEIKGMCIHAVATPPGQPSPEPFDFDAKLTSSLSPNVTIMGKPAATVGSIGYNLPVHFPKPPSIFPPPVIPSNKGEIIAGSATVKINGKAAARNGDNAKTCSDDQMPSTVVASGTVTIG